MLQTAGRYAWGLDYRPWDLRCLFHPMTFVWPLPKAAHGLGVRDPAALSWLGTIPAPFKIPIKVEIADEQQYGARYKKARTLP